jgi:hypothetical protein
MDMQHGLIVARTEGREEGRQEGLVTVAKNLIKMGIETNKIVELTGLSRESVASLQKEPETQSFTYTRRKNKLNQICMNKRVGNPARFFCILKLTFTVFAANF